MRNAYRVPKRQWAKWPEKARETFNWLFGLMTKSPQLFAHPTAPKAAKAHLRTTAWNAAWLAAEAVKDAVTA